MTKKVYTYKITCLMLILLLCFNNFFIVTAVEPSIDNIIYETTNIENITTGVLHKNIKRFTDLGWLNINILEVDLTNPYIKIDNITHNDSLNKPETTSFLTETAGAIAGINASFFYSSGLDEDGRDKRNPIGPQLQSGQLVTITTQTNNEKDEMATFSLDKFNRAFYDYWKVDINIQASNGQKFEVNRYNDPHFNYGDLTILDRKYSEKSIGIQSDVLLPDIFEIVVQNGRIQEFREQKEAVSIPVNGYVIVTGKNLGNKLKDKFKVGDSLSLNINTTPNWGKINMAVSGGALLIREGIIPEEFTHYVKGRTPRTAMGTSEDGRKLFMVTVDGRQEQSVGMTMEEMAALMKEIGAFNAINLDGGGSTTMVAREPGLMDISVVNSLSGGIERYVPNVVGLFSIAPPAPLEGLLIDITDQNIFVNTGRDLAVKGYDSYLNPITINPNEVIWSVSGVEGDFYGNTFIPKSKGQGFIEANVQGVTAKVAVNCLESPERLELSSKSITIVNQEQEPITVIGYDNNGAKAAINYQDINWRIIGGIGYMDDGVFCSTNYGYGYIEASIENVYSYCGLTVLPKKIISADDFQIASARFSSYPNDINGSFSISNDVWHSGGSSGKLSYNFKMGKSTQAVYAKYNNNGILLSQDTIKVGLWVYNSIISSNRLKIEVYDSNNKIHRLDNNIIMDWIGWKYIEFPIENILLPARLTSIYLIQLNSVTESGEIYLDDLNITVANRSLLPQDGEIKQSDIIYHNSFEQKDASFLSYPYTVSGNYMLTNTEPYSGSKSGKLDYIFSNDTSTQAAYVLFDNGGIDLPKHSKKIGLYVNSKNKTDSWIRAEIIDAKGQKKNVMLSKGINWSGWKYTECELTNIELPAKLKRVYVVNINPTNETNTIFLDDLYVKSDALDKITIDDIPEDTQGVDPLNKEVAYELGNDNFRFAVFGKGENEESFLEMELVEKMSDKINKYIDAAFFVGNKPSKLDTIVQKPHLNTSTNYNSFDIKGSRFIQLDTTDKSIRTSIQGQWEWLKQQLNSFAGDNIFIFLQENPNEFTDSLEKDFLLKILSHYKEHKFNNVWVFYKGDENRAYIESGVRFISSAGLDVEGLSAFNTIPAKYILVTVMGNEVTYQYKLIDG